MNAEARAKELLSALFQEGLLTDVDGNLQASVDIIAAAIATAQNDKLEEAERAILNEHSVAESADLNIGLLRAARAVKATRLSTPEKD